MYDLQQLGWFGFQQLCNSIIREILGQTAMTFISTGDGGRDGSFSGQWKNENKELLKGEFVIQCKFTAVKNYHLKFSDLKDEIPKAKSLVAKGLCDIYILMTNAGVTGTVATKVQTELKAAGVKYVFVYGSTWICDQIRDHVRLRRLVPRLYGLGDLTQILDERVYSQGKVLLESLKEDLAKVVITSAYHKAAQALEEHGFVLLVGEPAAGKTTIASLLAMGALDQWGALTMKMDTAEQVVEHWNPKEPDQFFWVDDAFGVTQYELNLSHQWNHCLPQIKAILKGGAKIVMTSRDYIYNAARKDLKVGAFPLLNESQVVIDVHDLSLIEKKQILYNHIKMGRQPKIFKTQIKGHLENIAQLKRFIPETARRLADPFFTKNLFIYEYALEDFVNKQESFLVEVLKGMDKDSKAALALIYMNNDKLKSPVSFNSIESDAIDRLGSSLSGCISALEAMMGNLVQNITVDDQKFWKFKHPTIGDAFSIFVVSSPDLIEIYLQGSSVDKLLEQITCGDVGIKNAVIVTKDFYPLILDKLRNFKATQKYKTEYLQVWGAKRKLHNFLSARCTSDFLRMYVDANPEILKQVINPGLKLDTVSEVDMACTLFRANLLPENYRKTFVENVSAYAIDGEDLYALHSEKVKELFTEAELTKLKKEIEEKLLPDLSAMTRKWKSNYNKNDNAEDHMEDLKENLSIIKREFSEVLMIIKSVEEENKIIDQWIAENTEEERDLPDRESLAGFENEESENTNRSIFDDIDI